MFKQKSMEEDIKTIYENVNYKILTLHVYRQLYEQIFGDKEKIELVNRSAKFFFSRLQSIFVDTIILHISKLIDPARTRSHENLSLRQLLEQIENDKNSTPKLLKKMRSTLAEIKELSNTFNKQRNKRIAHSDLDTNTKTPPPQLPIVSKDKVDRMLELLDKFMNHIHGHYRSAHQDYDVVLPVGSSGDALIRILKKAEAYDELADREMIDSDFWMKKE